MPNGRPPNSTDEITQYRNAVRYGDISLGTLIDGLRARGLYANTVWVIYGDHGEAFGQHDGNYGHTFFLYDENIHVPFVIAVPGLIRNQQRVRKAVSLVDTAPAILDLLGIPAPADYQGRTMLDGTPRMALYFTDYSLGFLGVRDGPWKFIYEIESGKSQLFNGCSPLKRSESPRDIRCILMGFATFGQFSSRVYANVAVGQGFWQAEVQGVQQSAAGWIRFRYAQTTAPVLHFHFGRAQHLQLM